MTGPLLVYSPSWLPRTHSIASTLLSLESEAFWAILLLHLIPHLTLAGMEYALYFSTSQSLFPGLFPPGSHSLPSAIA